MREKYDKTFLWHIVIDDVVRAAATSVTGLEMTVGKVVIPEGGNLVDIEEPGKVKFKDIEIKRGMTDDYDLYMLFTESYDPITGTGSTAGSIVPNPFDIVQMDRDGVTAIRRWRVKPNFWNVYSLTDWDASKEEAMFEKIGCSVARSWPVPV